MEYSGANVRIGRIFRGMTQKELAEAVSASEGAVWQMEHDRKPSDILIEAAAEVLGFKQEFFFHPINDEFTEAECNFRSRKTTAQKIKKHVLARGTLFGEVVRKLGEILRFPKFNVPALSNTDIDKAANECRRLWGLGEDQPIKSMTSVLEHAGVMVTRLDVDSAKLDAFSRYSDDSPVAFVVLNTAKASTSRARWDMAHELGHLVIHRGPSVPHVEREKQAYSFAQAFLLPARTFAREFWNTLRGGRIDWIRLFDLKRHRKVSIQAMIYRAYGLDLLDAVEYRRAYKYISARGWRKKEPEEPPSEPPAMFRQAMHKLWESRRRGASDLARELYWEQATFADVTGLKNREPGGTPDGLALHLDRNKSTERTTGQTEKTPWVAVHDSRGRGRGCEAFLHTHVHSC